MSHPDAACLLMSLHGSLLRLASCKLGKHTQGLSVAAKELAKESLIDNKLRRQLTNIDTTVSYLRHVTQALCTKVLSDLEAGSVDSPSNEKDKNADEVTGKKHKKQNTMELDVNKKTSHIMGSHKQKSVWKPVAVDKLAADAGSMDEPALKKAKTVTPHDLLPIDPPDLPLCLDVPLLVECVIPGAPREEITNMPKVELPCPSPASNDTVLEIDDWVLVHGRLASLLGFGYGSYANEVRVLDPTEPMGSWTAGKWVARSSVKKLPKVAKFCNEDVVLSAVNPPSTIFAGSTGSLITFDRDNDLIVKLDGHPERPTIFLTDAHKLIFG